jgi:hypothetical protein
MNFTSETVAMQYPHWMMLAGAALVAVGFVGFAFRKSSAASDEDDSEQRSPTEEPPSIGDDGKRMGK